MKSMTKMTRFNKVMSLVLAVLMLAGLLVPFTVSAAIENDGVENEYSLKIVDANGQDVSGALVSVTAEGVTETDVHTDENGVAVFKAVGSDELNVVINNICKDGDNELIAASFNVTLKKDVVVEFAFEAEAPAEPTVSYSTDWTKEDVVLTATSTSEDVAYYKWSDGTKSNTLTVTENRTYTVVAVDGFKNESAPASVTVTNIDKTAPVVSVTSAPDNRYHQSITVTVTATDENGSGVAFYKKDGNEWVAASQENANIFTVTDNGKHIFSVKDAAGNEQSVEFDVDVIDTEKPTISTIVPADDKWHNDFVEYTVTATDDKTDMELTYGVGESFETVIWGTRGDNTIAVDERKAYIFWVKDSAGNISDPFTLAELPKIDKVAPVISDVVATDVNGVVVTAASENWTNQPVTFTVSATDEGGSNIVGYSIDNVTWQDSPVFADIKTAEVIKFYVKDAAGNVSEVVNKSANYDVDDPTIDSVVATDVNGVDVTKRKENNNYTDKAVTFTVTGTDKGGAGCYQYQMQDGSNVVADWQDSPVFSEVVPTGDYKFYVKDKAGNVSLHKWAGANYDVKAPVLENVTFEQKNDGKIAETLNFLTFGKFFNKTATATVTADDYKGKNAAYPACGIKSYTLVFFDEDKNEVGTHTQTVGVDEKANVFVLDYDFAVNFKGTVKVTIADALGNTLEKESLTTQNSNIDEAGFMIENDAPVITVEGKFLSNVEGSNTLEFDVTDIVEGKKYSGINTIQVFANGFEEPVLNNEYSTEKTDKVKLALAVDAVNKTVNGVSLGDKWSDEKIEFTFKVCDNAGNQPDAVTHTVYLDQTAPEIVGFDFASVNGVTEEVATLDEYGYYFVNDATVTITAQDVLGTNENADNGVSGVDTITYAAVDVDGTPKYSGTIKAVDNKISFDISAADGFKGTIYAYATDKVGNAPAVNAENYEGYTHPAASIFETQENHKLRDEEEDYIVFESKTETVTDQTFYSKDVELNVVVKDPYNGIQKVEWSVVGSADDAENNYSGSFTVDNKLEDGNAKITYADPAAKETDWVISSTDSLLDPIDKNLVVEMSNTMVVTNDYDGIVVTVTITDRAGNVSSETYTLSIDKTIPVVESIAPYAIVDKTAGWTNGESIVYTVTASDYWTDIAKYGYALTSDVDEEGFIKDASKIIEWKSEGSFEIKDTKHYSFFAMDNAGHISKAYKMDEHPRIDRTPVTIDSIVLSNTGWTNDAITFTVNAHDPLINCGCADCDPQVQIASGIAAYKMDDGEWIPVTQENANQFVITDGKEHTFYVMDYAGNVTEATKTATNFDARIPELVDVVFDQQNDTVLAEAINFLTFGTFFKKNVTVTVNTTDISDFEDDEVTDKISHASGVRKIELIFKDMDGNVVEGIPAHDCKLGNEIDNVFTIPEGKLENFRGTVWLVISDHATTTDDNCNVTDEIQITTDNSNIGFTEFMIENDATKINNVAPADKTIHKDDFALTFDVSDITDKHYAGINAVQVVVNNTVVMLDDLSAGVEGVAVNAKDYSFAIDTKDKTIVNPVTDSIVLLSTDWNSGTLNVVITVVDNAGNVSTDEKTFYIDKNSPVIDGFEFSLDENIADNVGVNGELYKSINIDPIYGFYFKDAVTVTVTASDSIYTVENDATNSESIASGVATITYAYDGFDFAGNVVSKTETIAVDENNQITFTVPTGFKGQIYAYATDVVGNHPNDEEATFTDAQNSITKADAEADARFANYIGWSRPNGQVIETQTQHDGELEHILFAVPETKYTQNNNIPLYNKDVPVTITVKDTYSGIAKVEWTVEGEHDAANNKSGVVNIDNALNLDDASWTVLKTEDNLVTEIQNTIVVNNNCNDIKINVKVTDRAGNVSETTVDGTYKTLVFGIDKTIPTIDITYDNNTPDAQYTDIYNKDRTATVVITERNFRAKDVVFKITSTDGTIPSIDLTKEASWKTVAGETPDKTTHVAVFTYNADGDYTFDISYKDNAENAAPAVAQHKFTIDKTLPVISSVVYDNNDVRNGNYYKADRVATITIVEHNFDPARIVNLGVATDDATPVVFPAISAWTTVGDTHTATIHYSADALYTFDIDFKDMAGNNIEDYVPHAFYVDKTRPTLVIDGVAANSANKSEGNIGFTITAADTNMDVFAPVVKAMVLNPETGMFVEKTINIGTAITGHNTASYVVTNLIDDGVYSITCSVVDKAGNSFDVVVLEDENGATFTERVSDDKPLILFSVNRNGSTFYVDDPYTKELALEGGRYYTQKVENDLLIKEFNPDSIQLNDVTITVNGQKLEEGTDYERTASQNGGYTYLYTIYKTNFESEGEYNIVIGTKDRATNEAYSDMKFGAIKFVVDKTAPVVTVTGLKTNGRYQVEEQTVTLAPTDDGGLITKLRVILTDKEGNEIEELLILEGEELADALAKGSVSFNIPAKNSAQYVKVICEDKAGNKIGADGLGEVFSNVTITTNAFLIFWANPVARYSAIAAVVVLAAAIIFFVILKNKKKNGEADK